MLRRQRTYLPADLCQAEGMKPEDVFGGATSDQMREVVFRVASAAKVQSSVLSYLPSYPAM